MKTAKKFGWAAFLALSLSLTACSGSDDSGSSSSSSASTYINAKVDGTAFKTLVVSGHPFGVAARSGTGESTLISVTGSSAESLTAQNVKTINMTLIGITAPGTYTFGPESSSTLAYVDSALGLSWDTSNCSGATAQVVVTTLNATKIEGTFTFTGKDDENCSSQKVVTEGKFRGTFAN